MTSRGRARHSRLALTAAGALALVSLLVMRTSQAAFTATTANEGNSFTSGGVELTDDDAASAMFNASSMVPGQTVERCIRVTYSGTVADPGPVRLYGGGYVQQPGPGTGSRGIAEYLNVTVQEGIGGSFANCAGFTAQATIVSGTTLAGFNAARTDYSNGAGVWDPSSTPSSRTYRFTIQLDPATPGHEQNAGTTGAVFVWEVST